MPHRRSFLLRERKGSDQGSSCREDCREGSRSDCSIIDESNWAKYQSIVTADVLSQKKHDKAILLVAFGSTWDQAYDAFDTTIDAYKAAFGDYDVFLSYSSAICINRAAAGENTDPRFYYAPPFWLNAFAAEGVQYDEIVVQSLQVIPGEEYTRVINYIKDFANNANGDLDDDYLANVSVKLGVPLLQDAEEDVALVAKELNALYSDKAAEGVVAVMVTPTLTTPIRPMCAIPSLKRLSRPTARTIS